MQLRHGAVPRHHARHGVTATFGQSRRDNPLESCPNHVVPWAPMGGRSGAASALHPSFSGNAACHDRRFRLASGEVGRSSIGAVTHRTSRFPFKELPRARNS